MKIDHENTAGQRTDLAEFIRATPKRPELSIIDQLRQIVEKKSMARIQGSVVDMQSANAVITVYDAINDVNKQKLAAMKVKKMISVSWSILSKQSA